MEYDRRPFAKERAREDLWGSWRWQLRNRITTIEELSKHIKVCPEEEAGILNTKKLPFSVTPYFLSLADPEDPDCPIRRQCVPLSDEALSSPFDMSDPCGEEKDSVYSWLVHRYPDRVLFLSTDECATYCRHCTRRRTVGKRSSSVTARKLDLAAGYLKEHPEVRDVLISGGDPLTLDDVRLELMLSTLSSVPSVRMMRIGTRAPVTLPMRITSGLVSLLGRYKPLWISIHFNHPAEFTDDVKSACAKLVDGGIPLLSQTVLLRGINDNLETMRELMYELVQNRIRPYYLYQCDLAEGTEHFRTTVSKGLEIMKGLRGFITGIAVPTYVIDAPGGGGKVPVSPDYGISRKDNALVVHNYCGERYVYHEPAIREPEHAGRALQGKKRNGIQ